MTSAYIVGGGIAGLTTAAYLLRDGRVSGDKIHVIEESDQTGGSLDAHGSQRAATSWVAAERSMKRPTPAAST